MTNILPKGAKGTAYSRNKAREGLARLDALHDGSNNLTADSLVLPSGGVVTVGGVDLVQSDGTIRMDRVLWQMAAENLSGGATEPEATTASTSYVHVMYATFWIRADEKHVVLYCQAKRDATYKSQVALYVAAGTDTDESATGVGYTDLVLSLAPTAGAYNTIKIGLQTTNASFTAGLKSAQLVATTY